VKKTDWRCGKIRQINFRTGIILPVIPLIIGFLFFFVMPPVSTADTGSVPTVKKLRVSEFPKFSDDLAYHLLAEAARGSLAYYRKLPAEKPIGFGGRTFSADHLRRSMERFLWAIDNSPPPEVLEAYLCAFYDVYAYQQANEIHPVLFTGYYEPMLTGSRHRTGRFQYPVYARPDDLVVLGAENAAKNDGIGRYAGNALVPYYTRRQISAIGPSEFRAAVIAWVDDPVDLFFLHIQGSGKIRLENSDIINVHYRISNGHPYKSIGKYLIDKNKLSKENVSMQTIRAYLTAHPAEADEIFNYNPRYVFFETMVQGPVGCFNIELTPGRSLALDREISPAGALVFVAAQKPECDASGKIDRWTRFSRFFLNQDTGSAIKGPGRADIFWGSGDYAVLAAGHLQHPGTLYFMVLKPDK
jgi:membrane-bound lytic murein transglycosylase A